jgi:hypothetical protein
MTAKPISDHPTISEQQNGATTGRLVPSAQSLSVEASKWTASLDELTKLSEGWDSYGASAPNSVAIQNARTFVKESETAAVEVQRIEASAMGGVGVTFSAGDREAVVEFYNKGTAHALLSDNKSGEMRTLPVATNAAGYQEVNTEIRKYLHGK